MAEDLKVGVWRGGGPPPGYHFTVLIPDVAYTEANKFLTPDQYNHAAEMMKDLATHDDPTHSDTQRVEAIENFHELKDKGGILGKINLRVFFYVDTRNPVDHVLLVLGAINKGTEGQTPQSVCIRMRRRLRKYLNGEWRLPRRPS